MARKCCGDSRQCYAEVRETDRALDVLRQAVALPDGPSYGYLRLDETSIPCAKTRVSRRSSRPSPLSPARADTAIADRNFLAEAAPKTIYK